MASFAPLAAVLLPVAVVVGALVFWRRSRTSARELDPSCVRRSAHSKSDKTTCRPNGRRSLPRLQLQQTTGHGRPRLRVGRERGGEGRQVEVRAKTLMTHPLCREYHRADQPRPG